MSLPREQLVYKRLVGAVHMPQFVGDPSDQLAGRGVQRFQLLIWLLIFSAASLSSGLPATCRRRAAEMWHNEFYAIAALP